MNFNLSTGLKMFLLCDKHLKIHVFLMTDAGNIYSPSDIIGLIHLLEHVLFYNLSKYPEYNYLQKFIDLNSGFVNTFITSEVIEFLA